MNAGSPTGHYPRLFLEERFYGIFEKLTTYRIDTYVRQMEAQRRRGRIFPFARGLRFSALLIYEVRRILASTNLTANWGQLLHESGDLFSPECDVIIHLKGGELHRWNGDHAEPIMDFRFVPQEKAVAIISCKSYLRTGDIDEGYCASMQPFVKRIWLFAECCGPLSAEGIRSKALESGYEHFWHLYLWSKQTSPEPNKEGWYEFVEEVKKLGSIL